MKTVSNSVQGLDIAILCDNFRLTTDKTGFQSPSKYSTAQVCHSHLREATHNTINFWHLLVTMNFFTIPYIDYRASPC